MARTVRAVAFGRTHSDYARYANLAQRSCGHLRQATQGDPEVHKISDHVIEIPPCSELVAPILEIVPLQLLAYHIAVRRGCDVDQPRNLAKSVTVE